VSKKGIEQVEPQYQGFYQGIVFPIFISIMLSVFPEPSLFVALMSGLYCVVIGVVMLISKAKKWHRYTKFRYIFSFSIIDSSTVMVAIFITRILDGGIGLFLVLVALLLLAMIVGHRYRRRIGEELTEPKTVIGKVLISFGSLGGGLAALLAYWSTQFVSGIFVGAFIYGGMLLVVLIFHAHWPLDD
jgi:hypothetical protein